MNIEEAKEQIKNSVRVYLKQDENGDYRIPLVRQRPIFLLGAPGIGKTAIMEQIAQELGIALVSYSMTHHTRQSALGLPFIEHKIFNGREYDISEYTMSEIIASIYDTIEESGVKEGILFLDEINCVSETLAPAMLQFLQYKVFGRHKVPDGWVVVTAGNPPEYNKSVREFDIVTMDRLKILEVHEDYGIWRKYASSKGIHGSILTYLDIKKEDFYVIETSISDKSYVTARGWEDLSETIALYEEETLAVDEILISQYLRNKKIVKDFSIYYDLYNKYKKDYQVVEILSGKVSGDVKGRARSAKFDERLSLIGLLLEMVQRDIRKNHADESFLLEFVKVLKDVKESLRDGEKDAIEILEKQISKHRVFIETVGKANALSDSERLTYKWIIRTLENYKDQIQRDHVQGNAFEFIKANFDGSVKALGEEIKEIQEKLHHLFAFAEEVFGDGQEIFIIVTELTANYYSAKFISRKGSEDYYKHNKKMLFNEREKEIASKIKKLDLLQ